MRTVYAAMLAAGIACAPAAALAAQACMPYADAVATAAKEYGEAPAFQYEIPTGGRIVIFISPKDRTVTVFAVRPAADGTESACVASVGEQFGPVAIPGKDT